jgi:hypothetical protein
MDQPCNATELCMFIGYVNYYCTCRRVAHISLNRIDPRFVNLLHGQTKCRKHLYNAFAYDCKSIACPDHNKWFSIHTKCLQLSARHVYHPRRKAGCLLLLQSDNVIAKLYCIGTVNTFNHSYSQRILRYALQTTFTFLWDIKT